MGANLGDRLQNLSRGLAGLQSLGVIVSVSPVYETEPVGKSDQPPFLNAVAELNTNLSPHTLLAHFFKIESALGRVRNQHWGPRTLDLDMLAYDQQVLCENQLTLPHPEVAGRRFVLQPWADIAPEFCVPGLEATVDQLLKQAPQQCVRRVFSAAELTRFLKEG